MSAEAGLKSELALDSALEPASEREDTRYSPLVRQLFDRRPHSGRMAAALDVVEGHAGSAREGAEVRFWLKLAGERIQATSFLAYGCPHVVAAASWMAQRVRGMQVADVAHANWRQVEQILAIPAEKRGRLLIVEDALQAAAKSMR